MSKISNRVKQEVLAVIQDDPEEALRLLKEAMSPLPSRSIRQSSKSMTRNDVYAELFSISDKLGKIHVQAKTPMHPLTLSSKEVAQVFTCKNEIWDLMRMMEKEGI